MATTGALTNYGENLVVDYVTTGSGQKYLALFTTAIDEDGTGAEVSGEWYTRKPINFAPAVDSSASNTNLVDYGKVTGSALTITNWALFTAATGGVMVVRGDFTPTQVSSVGNNVLVPVGDIVVRAD